MPGRIGVGRTGRVDWRTVLAEGDFARFARLRAKRKEMAAAGGVPPYMILTDAQMAEVAKLGEGATVADLKKVEGIGEARAEKWGVGLLAALRPAGETNDERRVTSEGGEGEDAGNAASCRVGREAETRLEAASPRGDPAEGGR